MWMLTIAPFRLTLPPLLQYPALHHYKNISTVETRVSYNHQQQLNINGTSHHHPHPHPPRLLQLSKRLSPPINCSSNQTAAGDDENLGRDRKTEDSLKMSSKLAKLGLAAVLAYGLFDAVTYTTFFVLAFLGYEKSTGKNPAANLQALLGIIIMMWTGNNVTRPFRVAGAAALAPFIDKGLKKIQNYFNFPTLAYAFALVVSIVAVPCLATASALILSRWGR